MSYFRSQSSRAFRWVNATLSQVPIQRKIKLSTRHIGSVQWHKSDMEHIFYTTCARSS